jgi:phage baseplate assembly protein W
MNLAFPFHVDGAGRTALSDDAAHVRGMIEQIVFTTPGERVMRPEFGAGVLQLLFGPASPEAAATAEFLIRGALQTHLGRRIEIEAVETEAEESTLRVRVVYRLIRSGERREETFERGAAP